MCKTSFLDWINIVILGFNGLVIYWTFYRAKNKDFEKHLFDKKLNAYEKINVECSKIFDRIDVNSSPFVEIYDCKSKKEWEKYYEKNIAKMCGIGIRYFEKVQADYGLIISNKVLSSLDEFITISTRFTVEAHHFDTGILVDKQDRAYNLLDNLRQEMRKDLKLEEIDKSLRNRLKRKIR